MRRAGSRWRLRTLRGCLATRAATWRTSDSAMRSACGGWRGRGTRRPRLPPPGSKTPTPDQTSSQSLLVRERQLQALGPANRPFAFESNSNRISKLRRSLFKRATGSTFYMERKCADTIGTVLVPMSWPFPTLKYKYISQIKIHGSNFIKQHSEAVTV